MKLLYALLVGFRFFATLQRGYIHPDEFFQGGQELFFGCSSSHPDAEHIPTIVNSHDHVVKAPAPAPAPATKHIHLPFGYKTAVGGVMIKDVTATWEFQADHALRSVIPPTIMTILPLKIYSTIFIRHGCNPSGSHDHDDHDNNDESVNVFFWIDCFTGWELLVIPRLFMAFLSIFAIDIPIWYIARRRRDYESNVIGTRNHQQNLPMELIIIASSWVTLGFMNRPFSNSLETMCLAVLCMVVVYDMQPPHQQHHQHSFFIRWIFIPSAMGIIGAIGLFTRFTFPIFALPVVLAMLFQRYTSTSTRSALVIQKGGSRLKSTRIKVVLLTALLIGIPFLLTSAIFVYHDTVFYASHGQQGEQIEIVSMTLKDAMQYVYVYVTPWNAFRYNSRVGNLSEHGLHPRITHVLVNFPMLYGPLAIIFILSPLAAKKGNVKSHQGVACQIETMLTGVLLSGLVVLSCAPHQEPRFLLPLVVPLVLVKGGDLLRESQWKSFLMYFWAGFNMLLMAFFSGCHQSAVVPSLLALSSLASQSSQHELPNAIIYYHTYMPPTFLTRKALGREKNEEMRRSPMHCISNDSSENTDTDACHISDYFGGPIQDDICNTVPAIDLQGASESELVTLIQQQLSCSNKNTPNGFIQVVAPRSTMINVCDKYYKCDDVWSSFQIATEDMPLGSKGNFIEHSKLSVYSIHC